MIKRTKKRENTMKKILCSLLFMAMPMMSAMADGLDRWNSENVTGHPSTWWHWLDGNVSRHGITADLEAMYQAGIREAQIFNVGYGYPAGAAKYLSPEWLDLVKWAATEAKRLGMTLCMHNGPGWSSSGGSWVTPAQSMQTVVWTDTTLVGNGTKQTVTLARPKANCDYYEDIIVLAFPTPSSDLRIKDFQLKSLGAFQNPDKQPAGEDVFPPEAIVRKADIVRLSGKMDTQGSLTWEVPQGRWTILRFGHTSTGKTSHPVNAVTGGGLEIDKLSAKAMDDFWRDGIQPILDHLGPLAGTVLNNLLIDSYETGSANWTEHFDQQFQARLGYDCFSYYPAMAGYCVESGNQSERFLWDIRKVCSDLMAENYYDHFRDLCHQRGILFSTEPYTGPFNGLRVGEPSDIVMGEFWMGDTGMSTSSKLAASIAHICGRTLVGAEAFTADERYARWNSTHADMKTLGDRYWCEGINRYIFHTYVHQPTDAAPGYTLGQFGSHFNRLNTVWPQHHYYMDYVNRSQYLLQQGHFVGDVLVFTGEATPNNGTFCREIKQAGFDYDEVWTEMMYRLTVKNGRIHTPAGATYRVLLLPESDQMTPEMLADVKRLVNAGAVVVGTRPRISPSLQGFPACDSKVEQLAAELWDSGRIRDIPVLQALEELDIEPDFRTDSPADGFCFIHRSTPDGEVYFVSNQQQMLRNVRCTFRVMGRMPEIWDPMTGQTLSVPAFHAVDECTSLQLSFQPGQSLFVVFRQPASPVMQVVGQQTAFARPLQPEPLPGLEIVKAEYNHFLPIGIIDVTEHVQQMVRGNRLEVMADNGIWGDPCFGTVKHLQVTYRLNGERHTVLVPEGRVLTLPAPSETGTLAIEKAFYGNISHRLDEERPHQPVDATERVRQLVDAGTYQIPVDESYAQGRTFSLPPVLRITYKSEGTTHVVEARNGCSIDLSRHRPLPVVSYGTEGFRWTTGMEGSTSITTAMGKTLRAKSGRLPQPIALDGEWQVRFEGLEAPSPTTFPQLMSLSEHPDEAVRHFSGTTIYTRQFTLPKRYLARGLHLQLQLGSVAEAAEVYVNGQLLGNVWCAPYALEATSLLRPGTNTLEVRVCNQWANHLIGEEHTGRKSTTSTWKHWNKDSQLLPAGLMGPVKITVLKDCMFK